MYKGNPFQPWRFLTSRLANSRARTFAHSLRIQCTKDILDCAETYKADSARRENVERQGQWHRYRSSHTLFDECIKRPKRSDYRKGIEDGRIHWRAEDNAFGGSSRVCRTVAWWMETRTHYSPFFLNPVPSRRSRPSFLSLSLSFSARTQMSLTSSSSSLFLRFPRYKSDPSDAGQFVARAWTQSPVSTQSLCVILDSVGMSDPLKGQHLILDQLWFTVLFPRIERLGRKKMWRIGKCQQCGWFLNCVVEVLEDWNNSRWSEKYFKDIFRKIVQLKLCKNWSSFNS